MPINKGTITNKVVEYSAKTCIEKEVNPRAKKPAKRTASMALGSLLAKGFTFITTVENYKQDAEK
jgi:hypothetical protein